MDRQACVTPLRSRRTHNEPYVRQQITKQPRTHARTSLQPRPGCVLHCHSRCSQSLHDPSYPSPSLEVLSDTLLTSLPLESDDDTLVGRDGRPGESGCSRCDRADLRALAFGLCRLCRADRGVLLPLGVSPDDALMAASDDEDPRLTRGTTG